MYTAIRFAVCIIIFIAVLALCKPVRGWFFGLEKRWKPVVFAAFCIFLPFLLLYVSPETAIVPFDTPEAAYRYLNGGEYDELIRGEDSALALRITPEGVAMPALLYERDGSWYISRPSESTMEDAAQVGGLYVSRLAHTDVSGSYWLVTDFQKQVELAEAITLNGTAPEMRFSTPLADTGDEARCWFFYLADVPSEISIAVGGAERGSAAVEAA